MDKVIFRSNMSNAYKRIGYGRLNNMSENKIEQTGYGTPVEVETMNEIINPETISPEDKAVDELVDKYHDLVEQEMMKKTPATQDELYAIQEAKRAPKIQVDQKVVLWAWLIGIGTAFISSAIVSFNGITSVAQFVGLSADWMAGLFFFFIELMYLIFLVAYLVLASRVDENGKPEKTWGSLLGMIAFGGIAVLANAFHTLDFWAWDITNPQVWAGVILSIAAPVAIISASKLASRVVFAKAIKRS